MKTKVTYSLSALFAGCALTAAPADLNEQRAPSRAAAVAPKTERFFNAVPARPVEKEVVTFLGVDTAPVSETLSSQLGLPRESGLVAMHLAPESPAAAALHRHDILIKFDDQLLVDSRQFSILVRNRKEGDEVVLTYLRAGKQATAKVKLGKHEVPKRIGMRGGDTFGAEGVWRQSTGVPGGVDVSIHNPDAAPGNRQEVDRVLRLLERAPHETRALTHADRLATAPSASAVRVPFADGPGFRATHVNPANSNMVFTDEQGSLDLTIKEGSKTLVAKNSKGEQVYSGPVNTPEERGALPPEVRERLNRLEGMQEFTFRTEEGFVPSARTIRPMPQGISMPRPAPAVRALPPAPDVF